MLNSGFSQFRFVIVAKCSNLQLWHVDNILERCNPYLPDTSCFENRSCIALALYHFPHILAMRQTHKHTLMLWQLWYVEGILFRLALLPKGVFAFSYWRVSWNQGSDLSSNRQNPSWSELSVSAGRPHPYPKRTSALHQLGIELRKVSQAFVAREKSGVPSLINILMTYVIAVVFVMLCLEQIDFVKTNQLTKVKEPFVRHEHMKTWLVGITEC